MDVHIARFDESIFKKPRTFKNPSGIIRSGELFLDDVSEVCRFFDTSAPSMPCARCLTESPALFPATAFVVRSKVSGSFGTGKRRQLAEVSLKQSWKMLSENRRCSRRRGEFQAGTDNGFGMRTFRCLWCVCT